MIVNYRVLNLRLEKKSIEESEGKDYNTVMCCRMVLGIFRE